MWVHQLPGRVRARVPGLRHQPQMAEALVQRLTGRPGIHSVAASTITGTLLICFNPTLLTLDCLAFLIFAPAADEVAASASPAPSAMPVPSALTGLTTAEVAARWQKMGPNALAPSPGKPFLHRLISQYKDVMQLTLMAGAVFSYLSGRRRDALTIGAVLLFNGLIGASQNTGAARSVAALRQLTDQPATVIRDGVEQVVPAGDLVPGDVLLLEEGARIPADADVITSVGLAVDESLLTGECAAVEKSPAVPQLAAGTCVVRGRGHAIVTATGASSTLGRIAALMHQEERPAPIHRQLNGVARKVAKAGFWLAAGVTVMGLLRGQPLLTALLAGTSLVISAIPEGLPALVTLALASGARRMAQRAGSFQNLTAVDAMGSVTTLCCDKTGTLTQGQMAVTEIRLPDGVWQIAGSGYAPEGEFHNGGRPADPLRDPSLRRLLQAGALCNNARLSLDQEGALVARGDATELAFLVAALKAGIRTCGADGDRVLEVPFDADRRLMTVVCRDAADRAVACVKGAPEAILLRCTATFAHGAVTQLNRSRRRRASRQANEMASRGLRVLAVAYRPVSISVTTEEAERELVFLGFVGMVDPPRPEAAETIRRCHDAGVRVVMITGDHPATAANVAARVGIPTQALLTGEQIATMSDAQLQAAADTLTVVARAVPEQKLRVVRALRQAGQVVAMTGDGVNDAPAMREADVGIAMGDGGTEVARAAAGLVLYDDHLPTIVDAIEEGRGTRRNIRHTARYLLGSNVAEVCLMAGALLLGLPLPLLPVQLLWMNLVGDGLPASALGSQSPAPGLMQRPPDASNEMTGPRFTRQVFGHGLRTGLLATGMYAWALAGGRPIGQARTMAMVALAASQVRYLLGSQSRGQTPQVRKAGAITAALACSAIYLPPLRRALQFEPLGLGQLALASGVALAIK